MTDDLLCRLDALKDRASAGINDYHRRYQESATGRVQAEMGAIASFWFQVCRAAHWLWINALWPIARPVVRIWNWLWRLYRKAWARCTYTNRNGVERFSRTRGGLFLAATLAILYATPSVLELVWDTGLYFATAQRNEEVYLINSQEILPAENIHQVRGCDHLPCTEQNSIYFRVRPTLFNHAWSLLHHGIVFFPDYVAAAAPAGATKCTITSYGVRIKLVMRGLDWYPDLLHISCGVRST